MDLYIVPLAGSFAAHVACLEAGITPVLHIVDGKSKHLPDGRDYRRLVPHGIVPAVGLPDGTALTELTAVLPYIADQAPDRALAPAPASADRHRLIEWLAFLATELHKKHLQAVFGTNVAAGADAWSRANVGPMFDHIARKLGHGDYAMGSQFTVVDCYLFWILFVAPHGGLASGSGAANAAT
ncbi:MAG: glutathione transferase GstA, partial [Kofleriaceae bacterium]